MPKSNNFRALLRSPLVSMTRMEVSSDGRFWQAWRKMRKQGLVVATQSAGFFARPRAETVPYVGNSRVSESRVLVELSIQPNGFLQWEV